MLYVAKLKYTRQIFKLDFFGNEASHEKIVFYIFDLFFHVESAPARLYYVYRLTLHNFEILLAL